MKLHGNVFKTSHERSTSSGLPVMRPSRNRTIGHGCLPTTKPTRTPSGTCRVNRITTRMESTTFVVLGETAAVNPKQRGTKCAAYGLLKIPSGKSRQVRLRLAHVDDPIIAERSATETPEQFFNVAFDESFDQCFKERIEDEADEFYRADCDPRICLPISSGSCGRPMQVCCGPNSSITIP